MIRRLLAVALILFALFSFIACGQEYDSSYNDWKRYRDQIDGYQILVPREWTADDDVVPEYRSTRFSYIQKYSGQEASFVYISVTCQDIETELSDEELKAKVLALPAIASWNQTSATLGQGTLAKEQVTTLQLAGNSNFVEDNLQATAYIRQHENKLIIVISSSTDNILKEVGTTYGKVLRSFRWTATAD